MIFLLLSILSSIGILIVFRMFDHYEVQLRQGIMINYLTAGVVGLIIFRPSYEGWMTSEWFLPALLLGILFYSIFRIMGKVTQESGLTVSSIATKMSVVIPIAVGLSVLQESINTLKVAGILLGLLSIGLTSKGNDHKFNVIWPLLLFLGSGSIDALLKLFQHFLVPADDFPRFISTVFFGAFITAAIHHLTFRTSTIRPTTWVGGVILGLVNFAALIFILLTLDLPEWESSVVFPINNLGIIIGSTILGLLFFSERLNLRGYLGVSSALASILLLYLSQ